MEESYKEKKTKIKMKEESEEMGDYSNDKPIGIHAKLFADGNVTSVKYNN